MLLFLPLWLWWENRTAQRGGLKFSSIAAAKSLSSFWTALGGPLLLTLRGAGLLLFIVALARPQLGRSESKIRTEGIDIVLVVDISGSMQAMDYEKDGQRESRINAVKDVVREFIRDRPNDRIGMVVFGTHAYVASPLTLDHDWLERNLDRVRIGVVEGNTAIGAGLGTGVNRLRDTKAKSKVIVLLTDGGENVHTPPALDAANAAEGIPCSCVHHRRRLARLGTDAGLRSSRQSGWLSTDPGRPRRESAETNRHGHRRAILSRGRHSVAEKDVRANRLDGESRRSRRRRTRTGRSYFRGFWGRDSAACCCPLRLENTRLRRLP